MSNVCLYFQIHQPWRLREYPVFDISQKNEYFDTLKNSEVISKVADKSYRPMLQLLLKLLKDHPQFHFSLSITGTALEQIQLHSPDLVDLLQTMVKTKQVEILAETYYHSLASLYSTNEFLNQVKSHEKFIYQLFRVKPKVFRNTELIYTNHVSKIIKDAGYNGMLAEGADRILCGRKPTHLYQSPSGLPLLLKHYQLSDDIAFRFSHQPLNADTYSHWISSSFGSDEVVNLFMDFETFGEHQWSDTGIFDFFSRFVSQFLQTGNNFLTVSQALNRNPQDTYDAEEPVSWADTDRDITAWRGNPLQHDTLSVIYSLEHSILRTNNLALITDWRKLQTSDHFYYMCTKWANDGDVHAYFSPYGSPYNAYVNYNNVLSSLKWRLNQINKYG